MQKYPYPRLPAFFLACLSLALPLPAFALMGGSGVNANTTSSPWAGVVSISTQQGGTFSGALIGDRYVLTAAHVVYGNRTTPGNLTFNLNYGGDLTQRITAEAVYIHPGYTTGNTISDTTSLWSDDIAVVKLASPVAAGVPHYDLYTGNLSIHDTFTMVAYGGSGDGTTGAVTSGSNAHVKRVGMNRIDMKISDDDSSNGPDEVFLFDFDGPTAESNVFLQSTASINLTLGANVEAQYAGGDSGSPIFVNDHGTWKIAGVGAFNGGTDKVCDSGDNGTLSNCISTKFGAIGGGMLIAPYSAWIQSQMISPVPEANTWVLFLAGIGLLAARRPLAGRD